MKDAHRTPHRTPSLTPNSFRLATMRQALLISRLLMVLVLSTIWSARLVRCFSSSQFTRPMTSKKSNTWTALCMYTDEPNPAGPGTSSQEIVSDEIVSDMQQEEDVETNEREHRLKEEQPFVDEFGRPIEEKRIDYEAAGTLGDIMSSDEGFLGVASTAVSDENYLGYEKTTLGLGEADNTMSYRVDRSTATSAAAPASSAAVADGAPSTADEGLVTTAGGTLDARFGIKVPNMSPLERIALTSNGNLQRIFSSFYDAPVHVHVDRCEMREGLGEMEASQAVLEENTSTASKEVSVWDRKVHLSVHSQRFCTAHSVVTVRSPDCIRLVHAGAVGIGQLFRYLDRLPTFSLLDAGRTAEGGMWRSYMLESEELSCLIREDFAPDAWTITGTTPV